MLPTTIDMGLSSATRHKLDAFQGEQGKKALPRGLTVYFDRGGQRHLHMPH